MTRALSLRNSKLLVLALAASSPLGCAPAQDRAAEERAAKEPIIVADVGFETPESVLHDPVADVYLVANINGSPVDKDDNGFITRLSPSGTVESLKWIDGAAPNVTLNAPKGQAIRGDTLFVADIDTVRLFHRVTGAALGAWGVPGATFLNDVAVGPDGTVYVTDSGLRMGAEGLEPTGTDAVYRFDSAGMPTAVVSGSELGAPNGVLAEAGGLTVVTFGSGKVLTVDPVAGTWSPITSPHGQFDGIERATDGTLLVSSWADSSVYRLGNAEASRIVTGVPSPASIGYDATRNRVLIPIFTGNRVEIRPVP